MSDESDGAVLRQRADAVLSFMGTTAAVRATAGQTGGAYSMIEFTTPPGPTPGPPAHVHPHSEAFYVLDGSMIFLVGERRETVAAGAFAYVPGGVVHTFANAGTAPARFLTIFAPGGFEAYFEEVASLVRETSGGPPDMARVAAIARKHGQEATGPPLQV